MNALDVVSAGPASRPTRGMSVVHLDDDVQMADQASPLDGPKSLGPDGTFTHARFGMNVPSLGHPLGERPEP
jgi:hypothetical protein